jgi:hypothetical protein
VGIKKRALFLCLFWFFTALSTLSASDFMDGKIKLTLNQRTGRFSIHQLVDAEKNKYTNLLWSRDAKTSSLSVQINNRVYKLGDAGYFKVAIRGTQKNPSLTFESPLLSVVMDFSFIKTPSSAETNGIRIDIRIQNWGEKDIEAGLKLLLDTYLGEKKSPQFRTNLRYIDSETIINRVVSDQWWLTKDKNASLMGSIFVDGTYYPDTLHFANWKRLSDAKWKTPYVAGRNFNALPFSVKDTAVAYFMEMTTLARWDQRTMTVMLATEDVQGFGAPEIPVANAYGFEPGKAPPDPQALLPGAGGGQPIIINNNLPASPAPAPQPAPRPGVLMPVGPLRVDLLTLRELIYKIDEFVYFGVSVSEEEIRAMEMLVGRLRSRYGSVFGGY